MMIAAIAHVVNRLLKIPKGMKTGKFLISNRRNGEFQFSLKDHNDHEVLASEGFSTKASCIAVIHLIKNKCNNDCTFDCKTSDRGEFYFDLLSSNGYLVCRSGMYNKREERDASIEKVRLIAPEASIDDQVKIKEYHS
jgi:hypothetical protein